MEAGTDEISEIARAAQPRARVLWSVIRRSAACNKASVDERRRCASMLAAGDGLVIGKRLMPRGASHGAPTGHEPGC
jgi:hypothetical protein